MRFIHRSIGYTKTKMQSKGIYKMKSIWKRNPRLSLKYNVSASLFSKSEDEAPAFSQAETGDFSVDLHKCAIFAAVFAAWCILVKIRRILRKNKRK